jgi:2-oxoglutarate dehydrogenase E2 component (dihydrolipoamide succinyltransferase)
MDEVLCELESDKATFELPAEAAGVLHIVAEAGTTLPIGGLVATLTIGAGASVTAPAPSAHQLQQLLRAIPTTLRVMLLLQQLKF